MQKIVFFWGGGGLHESSKPTSKIPTASKVVASEKVHGLPLGDLGQRRKRRMLTQRANLPCHFSYLRSRCLGQQLAVIRCRCDVLCEFVSRTTTNNFCVI